MKIKLKIFLIDIGDLIDIMKAMNKKPLICGIVALGPYNVIGRDGQLPWHSKHDFYFFKQTTMGYPCIFGKTTYEHMQKKPLPGRLNIVCSSSYKIRRDGDVLYVPSLEEAIKQCGNVERVFVCGGVVLYKYALEHDLIDVMYMTRIHDEQLKQQVLANPDDFTYFPCRFDWREWNLYGTLYGYNNPSLPKELPNVKAYFYKYEKRAR